MDKKILNVFLLSLVVGFIFEKIMAQLWQYDTLYYLFGVPVVIVLVWGFLLTFSYFLVSKYEKKTKSPLYLDVLFLYIPSIIIAEFVGTNILNWQINEIYPALIGNFMKAPITIYVAYYFVSVAFITFVSKIKKKK